MTVKESLVEARKKLKRANTGSAQLDAEVLLSFILKKPKEWIYINYNSQLTTDNLQRYKELIARRRKYEPVAYLTNHKEFYGLDFYVDKNVFIPRPETELLVEQALQEIQNTKHKIQNKTGKSNRKITIADIGTGSGCIAVSLAKNLKHCKIIATDNSKKALKVAKINTKKHGVSKKIKFLEGDFLNPLPKKMDIIICNPPYVRKGDKLSPEVQYEPKESVFRPYKNIFKTIVSQINDRLKDNGIALIEIGKGQKKEIEKIIKTLIKKSEVTFIKDYLKIHRVAKFKKVAL